MNCYFEIFKTVDILIIGKTLKWLGLLVKLEPLFIEKFTASNKKFLSIFQFLNHSTIILKYSSHGGPLNYTLGSLNN